MGIFGESKKDKMVKAFINRVEGMCSRDDADAAQQFINEELRTGRVDKRAYAAAYAIIQQYKQVAASNIVMQERAKQAAYMTNAATLDEDPKTDTNVFADWVKGNATDDDMRKQLDRNSTQHSINNAKVKVRTEITIFEDAVSKPTVKGKIGVLRTYLIKGCVAQWGSKQEAYEILCRACEQGVITYDDAEVLFKEIGEHNA